MSIHLVNNTTALASCLTVAAVDDPVLLYEDGVYAAAQSFPGQKIYVLAEDLKVRGISDRIDAKNEAIDHAGWVELMMTHTPSVTWS